MPAGGYLIAKCCSHGVHGGSFMNWRLIMTLFVGHYCGRTGRLMVRMLSGQYLVHGQVMAAGGRFAIPAAAVWR